MEKQLLSMSGQDLYMSGAHWEVNFSPIPPWAGVVSYLPGNHLMAHAEESATQI